MSELLALRKQGLQHETMQRQFYNIGHRPAMPQGYLELPYEV